MINSELLKEAIADAKAVRATSLANAKAALEEAFAPRFEAMFADKLKEEAEENEEGMMQEVEAPNQVSGKGGEAKGPSTKAVSKGNPKTPKGGAGDTDFKAVQAGLGPNGVPKLGKKVNETAEEEEESKLDEAGLTSEDLDEIIQELENEVGNEEEGQPQQPAPEADFAGREGGEQVPAPTDGDEFGGQETDINADPAAGGEVNIDLGPEVGQEVGGEEGAEGGEAQPGMNAGGMPGEEMGQQPAPAAPTTPEEDENINLEELLAALNEEADEEDEGKVSEGKLPPWLKKGGKKEKEEEDESEEDMDESVKTGYSAGDKSGTHKSGGVKGYPAAPQDASKNQLKGKNHNISGNGNIGTGAVGGKPVSEVIQYKVALKESYKTIEFLRGQINEVNLLNAKLLYTNKLFKEFAGVLDDPYRMKIVESFDLTKSVREVKLAYALLAESLNFGTQVTRARGTQAARPVATRTSVKQITEGFASKPVSSTKPNQLITEGGEMALRFRKLAGIKDAPKNASNKK